jgi:SulP family sulfate permease
MLRQLRGYEKSDLSAGVTVGVMLIPQGMAYALIAGMPPIHGLYAALVPLVVYALLGSSRQLAVGPVAMDSLLVAAGVAPLAAGDPERYVSLALLLALMVGLIQLAMGALRFGFLTNFLSHPVLTGFTSAAAIIIGASQLKHVLGVALPDSNRVLEIASALVFAAGEIHLLTVGVGAVAIVTLLGLNRWGRWIPGPLVVVAIFTALTAWQGLDGAGLRTVGPVPQGLPAPTLPNLDRQAVTALFPVALTIALVAFMESIAVARLYATRNRYEIDANQELLALGAANLAGGIFRAFPVSGGFSRTAVNDQAGARTSVATLVAAGVIGLTLIFFTGLFRTLPNAVLGAVVIVAAAKLLSVREIVRLWRVDRRDFVLMAATFVTTLTVGVIEGILAGIVISLGALVYETSRPHAAVLGRLPGSRTWRNVNRHSAAREIEGIKVFRVDAALCFANAEFLKERVEQLASCEPVPRAIVLDFHAVNGADSTALQQLDRIVDDLGERGIGLWFAGVKGPVMDRLRRAGLAARIGEDRFFFEDDEAVEAAAAEIAGLDSPFPTPRTPLVRTK